MTDRMRTLREWYRYLDQQARLVERLYSGRIPQPRVADPDAPARRTDAPALARARLRVPEGSADRRTSPEKIRPTPPRSPGRPRLERSRQQVLHRLLDPEVTLHEAALLLNISKSTLRRYTDSDRLPSFRSPGGQRRFHLSELLAFVENTRAGARRRDRPRPARLPAGRGRATRRTAARHS